MNFAGIAHLLSETFGDAVILEAVPDVPQPYVTVAAPAVAEVCSFLWKHESLYFDFLACITGIDNGPEKGTMEVIYHLNSIPFGLQFVVRTVTGRDKAGENLPEVPSVSHIWRTADWHEREIYDLFGIVFTGHPDLRRILMPADWEGFPLRKDYSVQEVYHGIRVKYEDRENPAAEN